MVPLHSAMLLTCPARAGDRHKHGHGRVCGDSLVCCPHAGNIPQKGGNGKLIAGRRKLQRSGDGNSDDDDNSSSDAQKLYTFIDTVGKLKGSRGQVCKSFSRNVHSEGCNASLICCSAPVPEHHRGHAVMAHIAIDRVKSTAMLYLRVEHIRPIWCVLKLV